MITSARVRTLHGAIEALQALHEQIHQLIRNQLEDACLEAHPEARELLGRLEPRLFAFASALGECLERLEGSPSAMKQALGTVIGTAGGWIEAIRRQEEAARLLRDDYAALGLALVQLIMLETTASALNDSQTASVARRQADELRSELGKLEEVLVAVLERELRDEGKVLAPPA